MSERYSHADRIRLFLDHLIAVCEEHGFALGHEDTEGAFVVVPLDERHIAWLRDAIDGYPHGHAGLRGASGEPHP
jgi:hypothetical protein